MDMLDSLPPEIEQYLEEEKFTVFHSFSRAIDEARCVYWDTEARPSFKSFLRCAAAVGVKLVHLHIRKFRQHHREEALELLEEAELERDEKRELERRIGDLAIYEGFTCAVELSFDFEGRIYIFELQTDWYEEWQDILDELEAASMEAGEEPGTYGGFYSNN